MKTGANGGRDPIALLAHYSLSPGPAFRRWKRSDEAGRSLACRLRPYDVQQGEIAAQPITDVETTDIETGTV